MVSGHRHVSGFVQAGDESSVGRECVLPILEKKSVDIVLSARLFVSFVSFLSGFLLFRAICLCVCPGGGFFFCHELEDISRRSLHASEAYFLLQNYYSIHNSPRT